MINNTSYLNPDYRFKTISDFKWDLYGKYYSFTSTFSILPIIIWW